MFYVKVTRHLSDPRWVTCNPDVPGRLRISPTIEGHHSLPDARRALALALDWYGSEEPGWIITLTDDGRPMSEHTHALTGSPESRFIHEGAQYRGDFSD